MRPEPLEPAPRRGALRPPRTSANSRLPFWLVMLGLALVLGAFSRGEKDDGGIRRIDPLAFDLESLAPTGSGGYTTSRPSNRTFALMRADGGRFYALYGPAGHGAEPSAMLAGVLVGDAAVANGAAANGIARAAGARRGAVHEFSLESGALRVTEQEGPFDPMRFVERLAKHPVSIGGTAVRPSTGRYDGRLSGIDGTTPAAVTLAADGTLVITDDDGCSLRGNVAPSAAPWAVDATYGAGCARAGEVLHGHAFTVPHGQGDALFVVLPDADLNGGAVFAGLRR